MTPQEIRVLRGSASRAAFARRVGVTPHSVYRWELPPDAPEARRPRGAELEKLLTLARGAPPAADVATPAPPAPSRVAAAEDVALVLPVLQRGFGADAQRAQAELVQLLVRRPAPSPDALALARFGVAAAELLQRSDAR